MSARATICTWLLANQGADAFTAGEEIIKALEADGFTVEPKQSAMMRYITGDDQSEKTRLEAQLEHMGGALGREIEIATEAQRALELYQRRIDRAKAALSGSDEA